jgi:rod shape-determining protein MreD
MNRLIKTIGISAALIVVQTTLMNLISVDGITPDILLLWVVYLALREGQLRGTLWGFSIGLFLDLVSGDFLGLSAISKTLAGFLGGYFHNENKTQLTLGSYRFLLIVLLAGAVHNLVYFLIYTQGTDIRFWQVVIRYGATTSLYTATLGLIPMFALSRKYSL